MYKRKQVPKNEYDRFCKEFVFEKIKGKKFGIAFCEKFGIDDFVLSVGTSDILAKYHIENLGYLKDS